MDPQQQILCVQNECGNNIMLVYELGKLQSKFPLPTYYFSCSVTIDMN